MRETLLTFLNDCRAHGEQIAVAHETGVRLSRWSYAHLASSAFQFARELEARGIDKGDRVLFWGQNSPAWISCFYGCLLRGVVVVPLDLKSAPDFVARVQQQVSAKLLLSDEPQPSLNIPDLLFHAKTQRSQRRKGVLEAFARHSNQPYPSEAKPDDLVQIVFTSGTTAEPKGVCLTHRNLLANIAPIETEFSHYRRWERLFHPLRFLCLLPLSHVFGQLMGIFIPQLLGAEVYFSESYKPSQIISTVKKRRINAVVTVPRVLETLRERVKAEVSDNQIRAAKGRHFLRNWWTFRKVHRQFGWRFWAFVTGGATLESETENFWLRLGYGVIQGYGMTETASLTSLSHPFRIQHGTIGKPVAGQEVKLSDDGEILVRGDNVAEGYWNSNGRLFTEAITDDEGWIHTGDIGEFGPGGHIYFRGRSKETIVTAAGLKIYPTDLEAALDRQPEIKVSAVIPFDGGTEALAVLIPRDEEADLNAAVQRANETLAEFQRIRHWIAWPKSDFPRTPGTRKVIKNQIAQAVKTKQQPSTSAASEVISRIAHIDSAGLNPSANLADDLKLDSLGRVELLSALEDQYQIELDEAAITEATTIADIERIVSRGKSEAVPYPYPRWAMRFPITWLRFIVYHVFFLPLTLIMCRVRTIGVERFAKVKPPVLFISNHVTDVDAALILSALPWRWRYRMAIAMAGETLREWREKAKVKYALGAALFNVFSLPRQSGFRQSFAYAGEAVDRGYSVLIFPEGTETTDGNLQPFKAGIGLLASELNVPVVPIMLRGLFEVKQRNQRFVKPGTVSITFGEPITFADETAGEITRQLESKLQELEGSC